MAAPAPESRWVTKPFLRDCAFLSLFHVFYVRASEVSKNELHGALIALHAFTNKCMLRLKHNITPLKMPEQLKHINVMMLMWRWPVM